MPKSEEHKGKRHAVEMQLALDGIHSKNHIDREENMQANRRIPEYVLRRYKQMYTTSILARYEAGSVSPTIANQMRNYLRQIADKLGIEGEG